MDNGLIFPYRRYNDPAEASNAKHASHRGAFGRVGGKSATQTCIR